MIDRNLNYGRHLITDFLAKAPTPETILDIGAGTGSDLRIAKNIFPNARLFGIESHLPNIKFLQELGIETTSANIERDRLPFADQSVDIVIANQIIEHCKEVFWIFHEVARVLKIGGCFIIGVPNLASLHNRALLAIGRQPSPIKTASAHVRGFTKQDIQDFIDKCWPQGFEVISFGGSNFYPFPPNIARPLAHWFPNLAWGIFLQFKKTKNYSREFLDYPVTHRLETNFWLGGSDS